MHSACEKDYHLSGLVGWLFGFHGISTFGGCLMLNPFFDK